MEFKTMRLTERALRRKQAGAFLFEYLFALGIGALVATVLLGLTVYSGRTFVALANYTDMNACGVRAMDILSRDVRQAVGLTSYAINQLVLNNGTNAAALTYTYDPLKRTLVREQNGNSTTLLTECDSLQFSIYQRTPLAGTYDQYPTALATNCKVLSAKWNCSRTILGIKCTTQTDEEAKIVIRKH
jgi:Tfp pilus assembly protein PilW